MSGPDVHQQPRPSPVSVNGSTNPGPVHLLESSNLTELPLQQLQPGPWQPRQIFDEVAIQELAASITAQGVLNPLKVVPHGDGCYLILSGERRWRAAKLAGLPKVPCYVIDEVDDSALHRVAILDNLHRANLRPGEEAKAVSRLVSLGFQQRLVAEQLGKSQSWVSQRLAVARLPEPALLLLDTGMITNEEAKELARLLDEHLDLLEACLEPGGETLKNRLGAHVPEGVGERVHAVLRSLDLEGQRRNWAEQMRAQGHRVLNEIPKDGDRRFTRLFSGSDFSRVHQSARLVCEVRAWDRGQIVRYCDDPTALRHALEGGPHTLDANERGRRDEQRRIQERSAERDAVIRAWLSTSKGLESEEIGLVARERIRSLELREPRLLAHLGAWLGETGDNAACIATAKRELATASEKRLLQLWFCLEAADGMAYALVPEWLASWLERLGVRGVDRLARDS